MQKLLSFAFLLTSFFAMAQSGTIDKTYGNKGFSVIATEESGLEFPTQKTVLQKDNKLIYMSDSVDFANSAFFTNLVRLNANGTIDKTFGNNGTASIDFQGDEAQTISLSIQDDGKIIATGLAFVPDPNNPDGNAQAIMTRLNANGTLDATFGKAGIVKFGGATSLDAGIATQPLSNGKILLIGGLYDDVSNPEFATTVTRFNANGTVDNTFGINGTFRYNEVTSLPSRIPFHIALDNSGNIFLSGQAAVTEDDPTMAFLMKITPNGTLDKTFGTAGVIEIGDDNDDDNVIFSNVKIQSDGKIVALKSVTLADDTHIGKIIRYQTNGKEDATFGKSGIVTLDFGAEADAAPKDLAIQSDGKILVNSTSIDANTFAYNNVTTRYTKAGKLDNTFGDNGLYILTSDTSDYKIGNILLASDNKILVSAESDNFDIEQFQRTTFRLLNPGVTATQDISLANDLSSFPNPVQNELTLNYTLQDAQNNISVELISLEGKIVAPLLTNVSRNQGKQTENIRLNEDLTSGVYFLRIKTAELVSQIKVVKM